MSSTKFPCGCKIEYDANDRVVNIQYCRGHQDFHNKDLDFEMNAANLEDIIYDEWEDEDIDEGF